MTPVDFQRAGVGIHEPRPLHADTVVDVHLLHAVPTGALWREDLADPVGRHREGDVDRPAREVLPTPAGEIRDQDVPGEVELGYEEDPPAAGTFGAAGAAVERSKQCPGHSRADARVRPCRPRAHHDLPVQDLSGQVLGQADEVGVRG